jgi:hypothetical protein
MKEIKAADLHRKWMKADPAYRKEFAALEDEFALAALTIDARLKLRISFVRARAR